MIHWWDVGHLVLNSDWLPWVESLLLIPVIPFRPACPRCAGQRRVPFKRKLTTFAIFVYLCSRCPVICPLLGNMRKSCSQMFTSIHFWNSLADAGGAWRQPHIFAWHGCDWSARNWQRCRMAAQQVYGFWCLRILHLTGVRLIHVLQRDEVAICMHRWRHLRCRCGASLLPKLLSKKIGQSCIVLHVVHKQQLSHDFVSTLSDLFDLFWTIF